VHLELGKSLVICRLNTKFSLENHYNRMPQTKINLPRQITELQRTRDNGCRPMWRANKRTPSVSRDDRLPSNQSSANAVCSCWEMAARTSFTHTRILKWLDCREDGSHFWSKYLVLQQRKKWTFNSYAYRQRRRNQLGIKAAWSEYVSELYRLSDRRLSAKLLPTFYGQRVPRGECGGSVRPYSSAFYTGAATLSSK
jgi:hypothetical protein